MENLRRSRQKYERREKRFSLDTTNERKYANFIHGKMGEINHTGETVADFLARGGKINKCETFPLKQKMRNNLKCNNKVSLDVTRAVLSI